MDSTWLISGQGLAEEVKNAGLCTSANGNKGFGVCLQCPNCQHKIHSSDVSGNSPGLPSGVKFEPSDVELLTHLAAKSCLGGLEPHKLIDFFIPTLESDELGICYTHPENLPGAQKDGSSAHFFYKISNAYSTGKRKRRRIENQESEIASNVRWHKTGRTKVVMQNGVHKGYKKIMVLYSTSKGGSKSEKCKWIMHQFHLGDEEEEKEGEYVVSKVFYQPQTGTDKNVSSLVISETDMGTIKIVPRTPNMIGTPEPLREVKTAVSDMGTIQIVPRTPNMICTPEPLREVKTAVSDFGTDDCSVQDADKDGVDSTNCLATESQVVELDEIDSILASNEMAAANPTAGDHNQTNVSLTQVSRNNVNVQKSADKDLCGISDLELGTPPYLQVTNELRIGSDQDSLFDWLAQIV